MESNKENRRQDAKQQPPPKESKMQESCETLEKNNGSELAEPIAELKWPLTHRERIYELDLMCKEFEGTPQVENIHAAKAWHSQFPLDEYVPDKMVSFQKGKKIEESELKAGLVWSEVNDLY